MDMIRSQSPLSIEATEVRLKEKWTELLCVEACEVTSNSNFFALGGNSMLILSLHIFISIEFNTNVALAELLDNAEFASMAHLIFSNALNRDG